MAAKTVVRREARGSGEAGGKPEDGDSRFDMDLPFICRTPGRPASGMWRGIAILADVDENDEMG